jgi:DNA replication protein DnaC
MTENKDCWLKDECNQKDCDSFCMRLFKLDYLYKEALISASQRKHVALRIDADGTDEQAFSALKNIENNIESFISQGKNLYIHSTNTGNGKSSWALRFIQTYFNRVWLKSSLRCRALFINVPRFLLSLKENISEKSDYVAHIKENILTCDIVVWDDIATKQTSIFESEHLYSMIEARIADGKSNIFTSNLTAVEMHKALGDRLYSRIVNLSQDIELKGSDKRGI